MRVSELAEELGVPASAVLTQCRRFGLDATWAGSELTDEDAAVVRSELADAGGAMPGPSSAPASTPTPPPPPSLPPPPAAVVAAVGPPSVASPAAVGSIPELYEALGSVPPTPPSAGFRMAGNEDAPSEGVRVKAAPKRGAKRRLDRQARVALVALVLAAGAFAASNSVDEGWMVALLWVVTALLLVVAALDSVRASRHVTMHPDRVHGLWLARVTLVAALVGMGGMGLAIAAAVGSEPAAEAPFGVGELSSVQQSRWGYQRLTRIIDEGWNEPAKSSGTCWVLDEEEVRDNERVEVGTERVDCLEAHVIEVVQVFAMNNDADAAYPGSDAMAEAALVRCADRVDAILASDDAIAAQATPLIEYPTEAGWADGDHDVTCVIATDRRIGSFTD